MPIYEYHCSKCGEFEAMQKMSDRPLTQCPTCRRKVTKLISSTSFQLKGSGWYVTDYARKGDGGGGVKGDKKGDDKKSATKGGDATIDSSSASDGISSSDSGAAKTSDKGSSKKSEKVAVA